MIKVTYQAQKRNILHINITGHARSVEPGENDLVCAGASSVIFGILNSLNPKFIDIVIKENEVDLKSKQINSREQILLTALLTSLTTIQNNYGKYIQIKEEE
ncbi:MAG: ribosomal-processing cysteine protease Prp [Mycoplasmataceae bacterium]|nr:ribosomal-processing cysteine protease Prp [Mycoplasmataceae bacterium]